MQGPTVKTYFARQMGLDPKKIVHVALTPCTAKKFEIRREEMHAAADYHGVEGMRDTDQVITTRELARWAKAEGVDWNAWRTPPTTPSWARPPAPASSSATPAASWRPPCAPPTSSTPARPCPAGV